MQPGQMAKHAKAKQKGFQIVKKKKGMGNVSLNRVSAQ